MLRVDGSRYKPRRRRRLLLWLTLGLVVLIAALLGVLAPRGATTIEIWSGAEAAPASCPGTGGGRPFLVESFEGDSMRGIQLQTQVLAATNRLFPDDEEFRLPALKIGPDRRESSTAVLPPQLLHAISWIESKNTQTHGDVPWGAVGPALISPDCGYGIMQITSTIDNDGGLPSRYEALVGAHFAYNIAAGARILAEKWNEDYFPVIGESDPDYVESWYYALWAYNGWAWINHPANPAYDPARGPYDCNADRSDWFDYPYQEKVLGCVINPPIINGQPLWEPHPVILPNVLSLSVQGGPFDPDHFWQIDHTSERMRLDLPTDAIPSWLTAGSRDPSRAALLGMPQLHEFLDSVDLSSSELSRRGATLTIENNGSGLLAWRVVDTPSWLDVGVQAGVALGSGYSFANGPQESVIPISAAAAGVPEGSHRGRIRLEFHYPDGRAEVREVAISLDKRGAAFYEAGNPQS